MKVYVIQLLATKSQEEAVKLFKSLKAKGLPARIDKVNGWYKVRIGNFKSYGEAKKVFLEYNFKGKGYVTFIDYEPSRTILSSEEKVDDSKLFNQAADSEQLYTNETFNASESEIENSFENRVSEYKSVNKTEKSIASIQNETFRQQIIEKKAKVSSTTEERREGRMDFWVTTVPLLILIILFLLIVKLILKISKKKNSHGIAAEKLPREESKEMKAEKDKVVHAPTDAGKKQTTPSEEKGSILSYGKLIIGASSSINGNISSKDAVIVGDNSTLKGTVKAEKYVKLGKNVKSGKIMAPIVHTIRNEEVPKVPQAETPIAGGIKSGGDLELSEGLLIQGNVEVDGSLKIGKKSKIFGNIAAKKVTVDEGTFISGRVSAHQDVVLKNGVIVGTAPGKGGVVAGGTVKLGSSVAVFGNVDAKQVITE